MTHKYVTAWFSRVPFLVFILAGWLGLPDGVRAQRDDLTGGSFQASTLGSQINSSKFVSVLEVMKVDRKKGVIHYKKTADLKGKNPKKEFHHELGADSDIVRWAQPGKTVIEFQGDPLCRYCVGNCWYGYSINFEHCYTMEALPVTYAGPVEKLHHAIVEILAGREAIITAREWDNQTESPALQDWRRGKRGRIWRIKAGQKIENFTTIHPENPKTFVGWGIGGPEVVPALVQAMKTRDPLARCAAVENLGQIGPPAASAVPALLQALKDADDYVPVYAAEALARIDPKQKSWLPILVKALKNHDPHLRATAAQSLGALGDLCSAALPNLVSALLHDGEPLVRAVAADSLSRIRNEPKSVVSELAKALKDPDEKVRRHAAGSLTTFGRHTREIIPVLAKSLKSREVFVGDCVMACLRWHVDEAVLPVCEALIDPKQSGAWRHAEFLGELGPAAKKAIPPLLLSLKDEEPWVRWNAAQALLRIDPGRESALLPILIELLDHDGTRLYAAEFLRWKGKGKLTVPGLIKAFQGAKGFHKMQIARALGRLGSDAESAAPALCQILATESEDYSARRESINALGRIGSKRAVAALQKTLQHKHDLIRADSALALWRCSGQAEPSVGILEKLLGNQEYRQWAAEYLREMGPVAKSAAPALRKALRDEDRWLAREAALALWAMNMQREEAMKSLLETLKDEEMTNQITDDLAGLGPEAKACLPALVANLKHYDVFLRMETAIALRRIDNRFSDAVPILIQALSNKTRRSAAQAAEYLGDLGPKARSALPALIQTALHHDDFDVYQAAVQAIHKIDPGAAAKAGLGKKNITRNPLSRQDVASLWSDLTGMDLVQAYRAFWRLTETPAQTVSLFEDFLKPVPPVTPEHLAKLVEDLKSDQFRIRQAADKELSRWGELAEDTLRKSLKKKGPLEFSRRVQRLLDDLSPGSPRRPRLLRTIQVLEYHDTPEARRLLEKLTQGVPEAWQTEEARLALERMKKSMKQ